MSNVFTSIPDEKRDLKVNTYDWTHENNLSTKLGMITPCFVNKVPAKTSFSIDPKYAFQFMPMVFPIQTTIIARMSFYKMPIRALWKNYQDWISSVNQSHHGQYVPPFISVPSGLTDDEFKRVFGTGSLCDHFGIPTTFDGAKNVIEEPAVSTSGYMFTSSNNNGTLSVGDSISIVSSFSGSSLDNIFSYPFVVSREIISGTDVEFVLHLPDELLNNQIVFDFSRLHMYVGIQASSGSVNTVQSLVSVRISDIQNLGTDLRFVGRFESDFDVAVGRNYRIFLTGLQWAPTNIGVPEYDATLSYLILVYHDTELDYNESTCPWYNETTKQGLKLSSYAHRMYDSVYNTFIRYIRNNPLYDFQTGIPLYNKVNQLYDHPDGVSDFRFDESGLFTREQFFEYATPRYANWEFDQFTTAVHSPQEGVAPLVGITTYANTVQLEDGSTRTSLDMVLTDEDGESYKVDLNTTEDGIDSVNYTNVKTVNGTPITSMYQAIQEGVSIADIRNVNAYTRYLEFNQRKGYRYKDIVEGRFDVKVRFDELLMPEFIGGFTREVRVSPVTQTVQTVEPGTTYDGALGSKAGDAFAYGECKSDIRCYCDEESIIMGIISFTPKPVYTQALPKWFLDRDVLDSFNPEFNNLGFQPLSNAEVAPIQYYNNDRNNLTGVFGYQRPWYHLLSMYDTAHGDFRGPLRNFLMHRVFSGAPKLTKSFLLVDPDQVNDVFNVNEDTDKIFGQIAFKCSVKLGVSRDAVPRLE